MIARMWHGMVPEALGDEYQAYLDATGVPELKSTPGNLGVIILSLAALGFLGLGAQAPAPEWGLMVSEGRNYFLDAWWFPVFPGFAIALTTLAFNFIGDGLRDIFDPRSYKYG